MQNNPNNQNFQNPQMNNNSSPLLNQNLNINNDKKEFLTKVENSNNPFVQGIVYPHPAGLMNVGQSCYMNATIECLSNIKSLSNHLIENYGNYNSKTQPLCVSYSSLLYELIFTNKNCIEPKLFKEIIGKLNPLFEGNHSVDAKDFILFIIETLHRELLPPSNNNNENNEIDFLQQEQNAKDENKMRIEFIKEFNLNRTIISDIFYGINRFIVKCNNCGTRKYSFQAFNLLSGSYGI
jgi:ubiquitin C-terminal hydrolase